MLSGSNQTSYWVIRGPSWAGLFLALFSIILFFTLWDQSPYTSRLSSHLYAFACPAMHFLSSSGGLLCLCLPTTLHDTSLLCYLAAVFILMHAVFICLFPHKISHEGCNLYLIYIWIPIVQYLAYSKWSINLCFMNSPLPYFSPLCLSTQKEWKDLSLCINPNRARHILVFFI